MLGFSEVYHFDSLVEREQFTSEMIERFNAKVERLRPVRDDDGNYTFPAIIKIEKSYDQLMEETVYNKYSNVPF